MRIGHYAPDLWNEGGLGIYVRRLLSAQAGAGHSVYTLALKGSPERKSTAGTRIGLKSAGDVFREARELSLDVLHLHQSVGKLPGDRVPTVRTLHGHRAYCPSGSRYLQQWNRPCNRAFSHAGCVWGHLVDKCGSRRLQKIWENINHTHRERRTLSKMPVHTVSRFLKEQMVRSGYDAGNVHVIHSPAPDVNSELFPLPSKNEKPRFLFLGRVSPQKGLEWLLKAFARAGVKAHLDVAGDGDQLEDMRRLTHKLEIAEHVAFHGWVEPEKVRQLFRSARALVFPSVWHEPAGLVTLEAAAHGRPVIASKVGGIPEYADKDHSLLVPPNDIERLAESIATLARDRSRAEQMGRAGHKLARTRFAMSHFIERLDEFYRSATRTSRTGGDA